MRFFTSIIFLFLINISFANQPDILYSETNHYTLEKILGKGTFGKVFSVKDKDDQPFAIKMFYLPGDAPKHFMNDAAREFSIGQSLNHPNIVKTYDLVFQKNKNEKYQSFIVMELIDGFHLDDTILLSDEKASLLSYSDARKAVRQLLSALRYAQSKGYFYSIINLNSDNYMIETTTKNLKIIDLANFVTLKELNITTGSTNKEKGRKSENIDVFSFYYYYFASVANNAFWLMNISDLPWKEKEALYLQTINLLLPYREDQTNFSLEENLDLLELIFFGEEITPNEVE